MFLYAIKSLRWIQNVLNNDTPIDKSNWAMGSCFQKLDLYSFGGLQGHSTSSHCRSRIPQRLNVATIVIISYMKPASMNIEYSTSRCRWWSSQHWTRLASMVGTIFSKHSSISWLEGFEYTDGKLFSNSLLEFSKYENMVRKQFFDPRTQAVWVQ